VAIPFTLFTSCFVIVIPIQVPGTYYASIGSTYIYIIGDGLGTVPGMIVLGCMHFTNNSKITGHLNHFIV